MIDSPCIDICIMNQEGGLCMGGRRTQKEVDEWNMKNDKEKEQMLIKTKSRKSKSK